MRLKLYFDRSNGERVVVAEGIREDDLMAKMKADIATRNPDYKIPYIRTMYQSDGIWFDVGSHTEFYFATYEESANAK